MTTWTEEKRQRNIAKHGVDLALAVHFEADRAVFEEDTSEAYGEQRFLALGPIGDRLYVYCFTYRGEDDEEHAISLRLAAPKERRDYARKIQDR